MNKPREVGKEAAKCDFHDAEPAAQGRQRHKQAAFSCRFDMEPDPWEGERELGGSRSRHADPMVGLESMATGLETGPQILFTEGLGILAEMLSDQTQRPVITDGDALAKALQLQKLRKTKH